MDNASHAAMVAHDSVDLNSVHLSDHGIFRESENPQDYLPDIFTPYLPPYLNPSRYPSQSVQNTSTANSTFETLFHFHPSFANVLILISLVTCTIWVIVMNLLIIGALWKGHGNDKEHVTDMYLINLAFTDVLLGIFVFPFMSVVILIGYFPLSTAWCNIWVYFDYYLIIASSYGFAALMCSYLLMLRWPQYYPRSKKFHLAVLIIVWIFSNAPWTAPFFHDRISFIYPQGVCGFSIEKNRYFTFFIGFTGLYIPLAISLVAGIFAVKYLKETSPVPLLKLLLKTDTCNVHPVTPPASASDPEFNDIYTVRRGSGQRNSQSSNAKSQPEELASANHTSESVESSDSPREGKRHSLISLRTYQRNKALQESVRKHFPLVATSLILFVVCRSLFYTYFGIGSVVPKLFPPDLSHSVYWLMHSYAVLSPVLHMILDSDLRRSVIKFVNEGTFQLPVSHDAARTGDKLTNSQQEFNHELPPISVTETARQYQDGGYPEMSRVHKSGHTNNV